MNFAVGQFDEWFVPLKGKTPVTTPAGTPVVTHHRELAEQIVRDITATGDPTARTNMFALQARYLDFACRSRDASWRSRSSNSGSRTCT